jgi:uncharacterized DUF497 family protein
MDVEWDLAKSQPNEAERGSLFELAMLLFEEPLLERVDDRQPYGEMRIRAIGRIEQVILHCVYTMRGDVRRIISLLYANRKERNAYRATFPG